MHCYDPADNHDKVYVIWINNRGGNDPFFVCGGYGKRTIPGMLKVDPKGSFSTLSAAHRKVSEVLIAKGKKGYITSLRNATQVRCSRISEIVFASMTL